MGDGSLLQPDEIDASFATGRGPRGYGYGWTIAAGALCALALVAFFTADGRLVHFIHDRGIDAATKKLGWIRHPPKMPPFWFPGHFASTLVIAIVVGVYSRVGGRGAALVLLSGFFSGANALLKWIIGRPRPDWKTGQPGMEFHPFKGGIHGLFSQENLALPSGDAALATATACALIYIAPRWWPAWILIAIGVAFQRIAENAHHLSDVLAAAALGIAAFHLARLACSLSPDTMDDARASNPDPSADPSSSAAPLSIDRLVITAPYSGPAPYLSLVIPCYNEHENVPELLARVESSLARLNQPFEVIIVDDGSTDSTPELLAEGMKRLPWLRVIRMGKNGGQSAAFEAGFEAARGELIATIDADLQNDPEEIPRLVPMLDEYKVDLVTGWRKARQDTRFRRWQSSMANRIRNWISQETVNDSASSLKVYRACTLKGLKLFNGAHRFFPTLVKMRGYRVLETPVKHSVRFAGTAKYGFRNRAFKAFVDLLAIRWMKKRWLRYVATEVRPGESRS